MTLGNVVAIAQNNVKRMLAYSSIAHAGYLVAGIAAGTPRGGGAVLFYLLAYAFMNLGAFAVVIALGAKGEPNELCPDYAGLGDAPAAARRRDGAVPALARPGSRRSSASSASSTCIEAMVQTRLRSGSRSS